MTTIEKMAKAMWELECPWDEALPEDVEWVKRQARAALQSLLPPDEGTVEAMEDALWANCDPWDGPKTEDAKSALTAAIQHILKEDA